MSTKSVSHGGTLRFYDDSNFETVARFAGLAYADDFLGIGHLVIPAAGSASDLDWVAKIVGAAPPTVAGVASGVGGQVACTLTSASQKQDAMLYWGDQKALDVTKGLVFEARFQLTVLPSAAGVQAVVGLTSNWIDGPDNGTAYLQIGATANGALLVRSYDGATTISAAAGVTLLTTDWAIIRIDATDVTDVKMFVNGAQVTTTGQINYAATGTLAVLQPVVQAYKASGTGVATVTVDYVKAWMSRA